jgi:Cu/Ag efflux protein CusF
VPGSLSNTLLQALGAVIDTHATKVSRKSSIKVIERGLFILDSNDLVDTTVSLQAAETHRMSDELKETEPGSTQPRKHVMIQSQSNMNTNLTHMPLATMNMPKTMIMFTIKIERVFSNSS